MSFFTQVCGFHSYIPHPQTCWACFQQVQATNQMAGLSPLSTPYQFQFPDPASYGAPSYPIQAPSVFSTAGKPQRMHDPEYDEEYYPEALALDDTPAPAVAVAQHKALRGTKTQKSRPRAIRKPSRTVQNPTAPTQRLLAPKQVVADKRKTVFGSDCDSDDEMFASKAVFAKKQKVVAPTDDSDSELSDPDDLFGDDDEYVEAPLKKQAKKNPEMPCRTTRSKVVRFAE